MSVILPDTPVQVFAVTYVLISGMAVKKGIEVIGRISQFLIPIFLFLVGTAILFSIPDMSFEYILPTFENGFSPIMLGFLSAVSFPYSEIILFTMVIPYLNRNDQNKSNLRKLALGLLGFLFL